MSYSSHISVNEANVWRTQTPPAGNRGWARTPYSDKTKAAGDSREKYFIVSADTHLAPPSTLIKERIDAKFRDRIPRLERDKDGALWAIVEGARPQRIVETDLEGEDQYRSKSGASTNIFADGNTLEKRIADQELDGVDAELVFPNGSALMGFWSTDPELSQAQFRIYNDWAEEIARPYRQRLNIAACIATGDVDGAIAEVNRVAKLSFRVLTLPNKPIFGSGTNDALNYNHKSFDPLWAAVEEADLRLTFHVSTGADPRVARGAGGAVVNYAVHALGSTAEPMANLCASGILDRFPKLRFGSIESGVGWLPWFLDGMDQAYKKHHMWVWPKLKHGLPSDYFRAHGAATFGEDPAGMRLVEEFNLQDNFCWANDYPHHEGTFPHSSEAIEREFGGVSEVTRMKVLGLNAARMFRFDIPEGADIAPSGKF